MPRCPSCHYDVKPVDGPDGRTCPFCGWQPGQRLADYGSMHPTAPVGPPVSMPAMQGQRARGATASMVLGIIALVTMVFGAILGTLAIIFGFKAKRRIRDSGGALTASGQATTGIVTGFLSMASGLVVVLAAVVFVLVSNLSAGVVVAGEETIGGDQGLTHGFRVSTTSDYTLTVDADYSVEAAFVNVDSLDDPDPIPGTFSNIREGQSVTATATLEPGMYGLYMQCTASALCTVTYEVKRE